MRRVLIAAIAAIAFAGPSSAAKEVQRVRYDISLYGLQIGRAVFESHFEGRGFAVAGRFESAGLARIFDRTDGTVTANGWLGENESRPNQYTLDYTSGDERTRATIRFADGAVNEAEYKPEPKKRKDWVPVERDHLSRVADPVTALLLPAERAADVCRRTIRVYDGSIRADLELEPAQGNENFGDASVTCRARFVPVSGYRKGHSSIAYLRDRSRILIGFEPLEGRQVYSLSRAAIATKIGTVHIRGHRM